MIVIGKSARPRCLNRINSFNLPVIYKVGPNSWMNSTIFSDFLLDLDKEMRNQKRIFFAAWIMLHLMLRLLTLINYII